MIENKNKQVKVLMFGWEFPPRISGGLGTACHGLTSQLARLGVQITFILPCLQTDHMEFDNFTFFDTGTIPDPGNFQEVIPHELLKCFAVNSPLTPYMNQQSYAKSITQLTKEKAAASSDELYGEFLLDEVQRLVNISEELVKKVDFDIIHAHDWMTFPAAVRAAEKSNKPLICHIHATEFDRAHFDPDPDIIAIEKYGLLHADMVITVSNRTRKMLIQQYDIPPERIRVIHNAVDKQKSMEHLPQYDKMFDDRSLNKLPDEKTVLFLGRITSQKGPKYFIDAAKIILKKMKNVRFVMAGSGDLLPKMIEYIAKERLQKHFHFTGFLDEEGVAKMFAMSDIYLMPSVSEPFGITPFEAVMHKVPIIVSKQSGITEVLENVIKVDFWKTEEVVHNVIKLLTEDGYANELTSKALHELEGVSWEVVAIKILRLYREVLQ